jgi:hypothetical protein
VHIRVAFEPEATIELCSPDDCTRLHVEIQQELTVGQAGWLLSRTGAGRLRDRDEAALQVEALRQLAADRVAAGWGERFGKMLDFAAGQGWLSADGASVRAHCEWKQMAGSAKPE